DKGEVKRLSFAADGKWLASGSWDSTVRIWDRGRDDHAPITFDVKGSVWSVAFAADSRHVAAGAINGSVHVFDILGDEGRGKLLWSQQKHKQWANAVTFAPDSKSLISTEGGATRGSALAIWWNTADGTVIKEWPLPERSSMGAFAPSGRYVALTCHNYKIYILR